MRKPVSPPQAILNGVDNEIKKKLKRIWDLEDKAYSEHHKDCNQVVKAVAGGLGIHLTGQADDIINDSQWQATSDAALAVSYANRGLLVSAGLSSDELDSDNGHVVILRGGLTADGHPLCISGSIDYPELHKGWSRGDLGVNWCFPKDMRPHYYILKTDMLGKPTILGRIRSLFGI